MTWLELTAAQRGLLFAHELAPENPCYTTAELVEFKGAIDADRLADALARAYREFEQLRTEFKLTGDGPRQRVRGEIARFEVLDFECTQDAERWLSAQLARPLDPLAGEVARSALLRLPDGVSWWWHSAHHVVIDGYGAQQFLHRVAAIYSGDESDAAVVSLAELVAADPAPDTAAEKFWNARLDAMTGSSSLAGRVAAPAASAIKRTVVLSAAELDALAQGPRCLGSNWSDLLLAGIGTYLAGMAGAASTRIGIPLMNRSLPRVGALTSAKTVCSAMNVLPLTVAADSTVGAALALVAREQKAIRLHPFTRQEDLTRRLAARSGAQLFGAQVNLLPFDLELAFADAVGIAKNLTAGPVEDMTICLRGTPRRGRTVLLEIDANPDLYDSATVEEHLVRLRGYLVAFAASAPSRQVADIPLLTEPERELVISRFNATAREREYSTLADRFTAQARATPGAPALIFKGETRTYRQLFDAAEAVAQQLEEHGVQERAVVGVALQRGFELFEAIYGVVMHGAVYLPLDPELPAERLSDMVTDAGAGAIIDGTGVTAAQGGGALDGAYLLFTSGSTGKPKGVLVGQRAIDNRLAWMQERFGLAVGERVLHKTPISFDVSIWEIFWPLQVGATVVIAPPAAHRDPRALADLIVAEKVSTLHFVPSMLRAFLADRGSGAKVRDRGRVRTLITSGETLAAATAREAADCFGVQPINLYGPTEAAIDVTAWDCGPEDRVVPIGRPISNCVCYVLDQRLRPVPIGVRGELWLGGVQLAEGYVGRCDLTAERFIADPFRAGERIYRSGDFAAWRSDGALLYLGRADDQVKLRGQRLELGEVEAILADLTAACAGIVDERLVVWYEADDRDSDLLEKLRAAAAARLPASLLPARWIALGKLPLASSGKIDRRALIERMPSGGAAATDARMAPRDLLEQRLCELIASTLGADMVAADADLFSLGGDSLRVLRLLAAIETTFTETLSLAEVFANPTAIGLARLIDGRMQGMAHARDGLGEVLTLRFGDARRPPLFFLPPAGGLGWCYLTYLRSLPADLAVHTIQAPGIADGRPAPVADLDQLAQRQLNAITTVVGDGAFSVAGWSLGGMAAQAVAATARAQGREVCAVVAIDAYPSDQWRQLPEPTEQEALTGILRLAGLEGVAAPGAILDRELVAELLREHGSALAELPERVLAGCLASVVESARIVRTSAQRVLAGDLDVIVATAPRSEGWLDAAGWRPYVSGALRTHPVAAAHGDLVRHPVADRVGELLGGVV